MQTMLALNSLDRRLDDLLITAGKGFLSSKAAPLVNGSALAVVPPVNERVVINSWNITQCTPVATSYGSMTPEKGMDFRIERIEKYSEGDNVKIKVIDDSGNEIYNGRWSLSPINLRTVESVKKNRERYYGNYVTFYSEDYVMLQVETTSLLDAKFDVSWNRSFRGKTDDKKDVRECETICEYRHEKLTGET